jgi:hypothetical protein
MKLSLYLGGGSHPEGVDGLFTPYKLRLLLELFLDLLIYPLPTPWRIRHEMLHRLTVGIFHAVRYPCKVPVTFHRHLPLHICQRMLTSVARFALESLLKSLPVLLKFRAKTLDLFNRYSPSLGIKRVFFCILIRSVVPQSGLM